METQNLIPRHEVRSLLKNAPFCTLRYLVVSHGRGKLHCHSYARHAGGWRNLGSDNIKSIDGSPIMTKKMQKMYGDHANEFASRAIIRDLNDQAELIRRMLASMEAMAKYRKPDFDEKTRQAARQIIGDIIAEQKAA